METDLYRLEAFIHSSGSLTVHPVIECGGTGSGMGSDFTYSYPVRCQDYRNGIPYDRCQKQITSGPASRVKVSVPRDYGYQRYLQEKLDALGIDKEAESMFVQGENLVFDLTVVDSFGNQVEGYDLTTLHAGFHYADGARSMGDLTEDVMDDVIHYSARQQSHNRVFQKLPPRDSVYYVQVNDTAKLLSGAFYVDIVNLDDPYYPKNIFINGESGALEPTLT